MDKKTKKMLKATGNRKLATQIERVSEQVDKVATREGVIPFEERRETTKKKLNKLNKRLDHLWHKALKRLLP